MFILLQDMWFGMQFGIQCKLSFYVPRIVLTYFHLVMDIFLRRAPVYVVHVSKHSAIFFLFYCRIISENCRVHLTVCVL
jgi:hypothetical protein